MGRFKKKGGKKSVEVEKFSEEPTYDSDPDIPKSLEMSSQGKKKSLTRKEQRKNDRKMKKVKKLEYFQGKHKKNLVVEEKEKKIINLQPVETKKSPSKKNSKAKQPSAAALLKKEQMELERKKQRVKQLQIANKLEDKNIKKMEKQLKLNKRKSKTIPKSFVDDGLDFLLELCDPERRSEIIKDDFDFADNDLGFEEDLALISGNNAPEELSSTLSKKGREKKIKNVIEEKTEDSDENSDPEENEMESGEEEELEDEGEEFEDGEEECGSEEEDECEDEENFDDDEGEDDDDDVHMESNFTDDQESDGESKADATSKLEEKSSHPNGQWEDIYGRMRDKEGNVVTNNQGKYIPPGKRQLSSTTTAEMEKLKRQMKGLINRLAESNLPGIVSSIEALYLTNSRNNMQQSINQLIMESLVAPVLSPERLIMEHCVLIGALHANVGTEVGAQFLEAVVRHFDSLFNTCEEEQKQLDNLILIIAHLYNFGVIAASLLTDILKKLSDRFSEKDIELILIILRSVGFSLRKEDPIALKEIILSLQSKATQVVDQSNRVRFMIDTLMAIRNNNMSKIPNYDTSHTEQLKKILRNGLIRKGVSLSKMNVSYQELITADKIGRWWVVGSAWVGQGPTAPDTKPENNGAEHQFSAELLEMARKQRMNTDVRRNIFCILMTADDYLEAFERLLRLGLKPQQEREILHVSIDCCLHEKNYNPYYVHLVQKFCVSHRRFQIATKFALWDRFQDLNALTAVQMSHLAKMIVHVVAEQGLTLAVLKTIQFTAMDRLLVRFLRHILLGLLLHPSDMAVQSAFARICSSKFSLLKEGLTLFMNHFLMKNVEKMSADEAEKLKERIYMAEQALSVG